ncbi:actin-like ATPase domain-containing protein [Aspergillus heteromorphus CBS 117.55]|uniref:Actin-like ATPase domain-containing protein n=1 Tax=Aspergillus heteromorphus CBS 117.55 TaxID=1448321 RepID=A0A317V2E6_9EURO|nr:actin-like ATPase domain-containing protein [Aspergillus heteromorphus CBS 117.55]PWY68474.1 actin-like ATPase domain-containing protein [Aspergillus heteromorphus CBS 117.55]
MAQAQVGPSIVVGVDFGTTFSGIAWAFEGSIGDVEVLSTWPGGGSRNSVKAPSSISYGTQTIRWGYQVGPFAEAFRGVKLLLDKKQVTTYTPSLACKKLLAKYNKNAVDVVADYLGHLIKHMEEILQRRLGVARAAMKMRFVLTVPAVWSDKAKDYTLQAAMKAGIPPRDVSLVAEPEAAAVYSLRAMQPNSIAGDHVIIVCDAGGGTVDLISYRVAKLEPLLLAEVVKGAGRICGSMLLDERFESMLEERMGRDNYAALSEKSKEAAMSYWQRQVKTNFCGKYDEDYAHVDYFIPIPGAQNDPSVPIEDGFFQLSSEDTASIFDPIVRDVESLVAEQVKGIKKKNLSPKAIILVGGFGASEYLFHRLKEANPTVTVMQPPDAGAVQRGLDGNRVESRIARRNYGIQYAQTLEKTVSEDSPDNMIWDRLEENYKSYGHMKWFITKFSALSESHPIKLPFHYAIEKGNVEGLINKIDLLFCDNDSAPEMNNAKIIRLCTVEADLTKVPRKLFESKCNSKGVEYFKINFTLVLIPTSASLVFQLEFNGASYGSVRSKY